MLIFLFHFYTGYSSTTAMDEMALMLFNIIYTTLPPLVMGILDQDITRSGLIRTPSLYSYGRDDMMYNPRTILLYSLDIAWQALVMFYVPFWSMEYGDDNDLYEMGLVQLFSCVFVVNAELLLDSYYITRHLLASVGVSICSMFFMQCLISLSVDQPYYGSFSSVVVSPVTWLSVALSTWVAIFPHFLFQTIRTNLFPNHRDVVRRDSRQLSYAKVVPLLASNLPAIPVIPCPELQEAGSP